jgi:hypothetical protein
MFVKTFKIYVIVYICNIISLISHCPKMFSIRVSSFTEQRDTVSIIKLTLWYWTQRDTVSIIKLDTLILNREILSVSSNWHSDTEHRRVSSLMILTVSLCVQYQSVSLMILIVSLCVQYQSVKFEVSSNLILILNTERHYQYHQTDTLILNTERYCQYHQTWHSDTEHREILSVSSLSRPSKFMLLFISVTS